MDNNAKPRPLDGSPLSIAMFLRGEQVDELDFAGVRVTVIYGNKKGARVRVQRLPEQKAIATK
jgi:hypothetical protein